MLTFEGPFAQLADLVVGIARRRRIDGPTIVAVGGYPYVGKTELAADIASRWPAKSLVLPMESAIYTRERRLARGIDGSSVEAHDVAQILHDIARLRQGKTIEIHDYSWQTGSADGSTSTPPLGPGSLVLLDGSVATALPIRQVVDASFALRPMSQDVWLRHAIRRDVRVRAWPRWSATEQNLSKRATVEHQLAGYGREPNEYLVSVHNKDLDWTARVDSQPPLDAPDPVGSCVAPPDPPLGSSP